VTTLQIDGDGILYRAGFAVEKTKYLVRNQTGYFEFDDAKSAKAEGGELWSRKDLEPEDKALLLVDQIIRDIKDRYPEHWPNIWLSPNVGNFRDLVCTRAKYKGNRDAQVRPTHYKALREHVVKRWGACITEGQEADDAIGIGMTANPGSVCVSIDKDLLQLAGTHYNWVTKEERRITAKQGALNFWTQVLTGDTTDNVPGIPGIGPVKAKKLLTNCKTNKEAWEIARNAYAQEFGPDIGPDYAFETAQLVWVRRKPNELWSPPC
jgi:hypothetical protein